jgi:hypothetical protein
LKQPSAQVRSRSATRPAFRDAAICFGLRGPDARILSLVGFGHGPHGAGARQSTPAARRLVIALASFQCKDYMQRSAGMYGNDPLVGMLALGQDLYSECMVANGWTRQ